MIRLSLVERVRGACWLAIVSVLLIGWSLLDPRPIPVIVAMTVGQLLGTLSLALFVAAILLDLRRARVLDRLSRDRLSSAPPSEPPKPGA